MPFASERQRRLMWAIHPEIAKRWEAEAKKRHQAAVQVTKRRRKRP